MVVGGLNTLFTNVTFEPNHSGENGGGQMLVGVAGRGWYQEEGKPAVEILPGTVISKFN